MLLGWGDGERTDCVVASSRTGVEREGVGAAGVLLVLLVGLDGGWAESGWRPKCSSSMGWATSQSSRVVGTAQETARRDVRDGVVRSVKPALPPTYFVEQGVRPLAPQEAQLLLGP